MTATAPAPASAVLEPVDPRARKRRVIVSVIIVSVVIHVIFGIFAGIWIIARYFEKPKAQFTVQKIVKIDPEDREHQISMQEVESLRPRPVYNNRITSLRPTELSLPDLPKLPVDKTVPLDTEALVNTQIDSLSNSRTGQGTGSGVSFFGLKGGGQHIAFLVDYSQSMKGARDKLMHRELTKSIGSLPAGTKVSLIFFSGPAWVAGKDSDEILKKWNWEKKKAHDFTPKNWSNIKKPQWIAINPSSQQALLEAVKTTPLSWGTDWRNPFRMMFELNPLPDVAFFMTDGSVPDAEATIKLLRDKLGSGAQASRVNVFTTGPVKTRISTIALGEPKVADALKKIAKDYEGSFRLVPEKDIK